MNKSAKSRGPIVLRLTLAPLCLGAALISGPGCAAALSDATSPRQKRRRRLNTLVLNPRRAPFDDRGVRQATSLACDFEWINTNLMNGLNAPVDSFFGNTSFAARGTASEAEAAKARRRPASQGRFHDDRSGAARGHRIPPRPVPGKAESLSWGSALADRGGSYALAGAKDPALDAALGAMVTVRDMRRLKTVTRAFDRVLRWRHYAIGLWRKSDIWLAYRDRLARPSRIPRYAPGFVHLWRLEPERRQSRAEAPEQ